MLHDIIKEPMHVVSRPDNIYVYIQDDIYAYIIENMQGKFSS